MSPPAGRRPTSHERASGQPWDASYRNGPAPWDIGRPQPAIVRLADAAGFDGTVLDAGCGTGENALYVAALGRPVLGIDVAETALADARRKAAQRRLPAEFEVADAMDLPALRRTFRTVLDCGLFHTFDAEERLTYTAGLAAVTEPGGRVYVLCFRDAGTASGPHPVTAEEVAAAFDPAQGWRVAALDDEVIETNFDPAGLPAWLVTVERR